MVRRPGSKSLAIGASASVAQSSRKAQTSNREWVTLVMTGLRPSTSAATGMGVVWPATLSNGPIDSRAMKPAMSSANRTTSRRPC